jgi:hypothetical protein
MDLKRLFVLSLIAMALLLLIEPAYAFLWPPAIGSCGLGGLWGLYGPCGPLSWGCGLGWGGFW